MANDPRSTKHPDPARPEDSLIPNPGDPYFPGQRDPAYPNADRPAQQQADQAETSESGRRQMKSDQGSTRRQGAGGQPKGQQSGWQMPSDQQQLTDNRRGKRRQQSAAPTHEDFGDPSPGDENPRPLQPGKPQRS